MPTRVDNVGVQKLPFISGCSNMASRKTNGRRFAAVRAVWHWPQPGSNHGIDPSTASFITSLHSARSSCSSIDAMTSPMALSGRRRHVG